MNSFSWKNPRAGAWAAAVLAVAVVAVYAGTFSAPFELDDQGSIPDNPTIRSLSPPWAPLSPPQDAGGITVNGRPLLNLSLALNYAVSGTEVWSYHLGNLCIHVCAALVLFGLVRRTLLRMNVADSQPLAFAVAALWSLHPLQTEAVTYVIQRAESLAGLFYLLTLYCYLRGACPETGAGGPASGTRWYVLSALACLCGMATKEIVASAPVIVFLHDRTFVAGTFREAWRRRRGLYSGLVASWILLGYLVIAGAGRGGTAAGAVEMSSWSYALTQCRALVLYLKLAIWPSPLVFDYGMGVVTGLGSVWWQGIVVIGLVCSTLFALRRWPAFGFLGAVFFAVLAPSSSFVPVATQTIAEHRMYLPLAAVAVIFVVGLHGAFGRGGRWVAGGLALALGVLTVFRNSDYRSSLGLWQDTVAKYPASARAQNNLGVLLAAGVRNREAIECFKAALAARPDYLQALGNLGKSQLIERDMPGALATFGEVLRLHPDFTGHFTYSRMLADNGDRAGAISHLESALRFEPASPDAHTNLANLLLKDERVPEAIDHYEAALRAKPDDAVLHNNLGTAFAYSGRLTDALAQQERALQLRPNLVNAHIGMALALEGLNRIDDAIDRYRQAIRLRPNDASLHTYLANALAKSGRMQEAADERARAADLGGSQRAAGGQ